MSLGTDCPSTWAWLPKRQLGGHRAQVWASGKWEVQVLGGEVVTVSLGDLPDFLIHLSGLVSVGIWEPEKVIALVATLPGLCQSARAFREQMVQVTVSPHVW